MLERLAFAAELLDDPRARRFGSAAWRLRSLEGDLEQMLLDGSLARARGVDDAVLKVIGEVQRGERPEDLVAMEAQLPAGLFAVRRVKGLGPKKVKTLFKELGITTLGELEYACRENRLAALKGFGEKTQQKVLSQIEWLRETDGLLRRDQAKAVLDAVLEGVPVRAVAVGEWARGLELVRELAVLLELPDRDEALRLVDVRRPPEIDVEVYVADEASFGAIQVWHTSTEWHRQALVERAEDFEMTFDEQGLRDEDGVVVCPTEVELYRALSLVPTAPERREPHVPLVEQGRVAPELITRAALKGALHNHTVASDGTATLVEMRAAAAERGLEYLGISDHSHSASYARGLSPDRLEEQGRTIAALNAEDRASCVLLSGVESDILAEGALDYDPPVLAALDVVIASVHQRHGQDPEQMTHRMLAAARHPLTDIVGHPTGRLLLGRVPSAYDLAAFLDACAVHRVAVELNANPHRLDLSETGLAMARARGVLVSIAADAHATHELDHLDYGVTIARRAGLRPEDVLNTRSVEELREWVRARREASVRYALDGGPQ